MKRSTRSSVQQFIAFKLASAITEDMSRGIRPSLFPDEEDAGTKDRCEHLGIPMEFCGDLQMNVTMS